MSPNAFCTSAGDIGLAPVSLVKVLMDFAKFCLLFLFSFSFKPFFAFLLLLSFCFSIFFPLLPGCAAAERTGRKDDEPSSSLLSLLSSFPPEKDVFSEKLADPFQAKACLGGCLGDPFSRLISARLVKENKIFTLRMHFL